MSGTIGILNVGAGDTKLTFDKDNPMERARSARIVTDMLRHGYVLFIEVPGQEGNAYQRVLEFKEDVCEYIIADIDPTLAIPEPAKETAAHESSDEAQGEAGSPAENETAAPAPGGRSRKRKSVDAGAVRGVAVGRTAGG